MQDAVKDEQAGAEEASLEADRNKILDLFIHVVHHEFDHQQNGFRGIY
jgi:hypothetical protein